MKTLSKSEKALKSFMESELPEIQESFNTHKQSTEETVLRLIDFAKSVSNETEFLLLIKSIHNHHQIAHALMKDPEIVKKVIESSNRYTQDFDKALKLELELEDKLEVKDLYLQHPTGCCPGH